MALGRGRGYPAGPPVCKWFVSASGFELPYLVYRHRAGGGQEEEEGLGRRGVGSGGVSID